jgi:polyhydroxyalkanoate synthesis regulator phasin
VEKTPTYNEVMAYVGDLYVKLQEAHRAVETQNNQLVENLRSQLEEKTKLVRRLEEEISRLERENLELKTNDLGNTRADHT